MFKMLTIIGYMFRMINTIEIDIVEDVIMPFNEAANPVLADMLMGYLSNEFFDKFGCWRHPSMRQRINPLD